jgi:DNA mismatch endonuclease, patch repair protein
MADVFTSHKRSQIMSRVKSKGNKATELALVRLLRRNAISGWLRGAKLYGKPDFTFRNHSLVIFVDGCFWHGCPKHATQPSTNKAFWKSKLAKNKARDRSVTKTLRSKGWKVLRIWQHELSARNERRLAEQIRQTLTKV